MVNAEIHPNGSMSNSVTINLEPLNMTENERNERVHLRCLLRIKAKSLAAEARIIRAAKRRQNGATKMELDAHRREVLRPQARATCLALGLLRGTAYEAMEPDAKSPPNWDEVKRLLSKYGEGRRALDALEEVRRVA